MGGGVPECLLTLDGVKGHDLKGAVLGEHCPQILDLPVDFDAACSLVQTHADALDDLGGGLTSFSLTDTAVLQCQFDHSKILPFS